MKKNESTMIYHSGLEFSKEVKVSNRKQASNTVLYSALELLLIVITTYGMVLGFIHSFGLQINIKFVMFGLLGFAALFSPVFFYSKCKTYLFLCVNVGYLFSIYIFFDDLKNGMAVILRHIITEINQYYGTSLTILWDIEIGTDLIKDQTICILFFQLVTIELLLFVILFRRCQWMYFLLSLFYVGLPFAVGVIPPFSCLMFYVIGTISLQNSKYNFHKDVSPKIRIILAVIAACLLLGIRLLVPADRYEEIFPVSNFKLEFQDHVEQVFSNMNLKKLIRGNLFSYGADGTGGIGYGQIGKTDALSFSKKTALLLEVPKEYKKNIVFLRCYVGEQYENNAWHSLDRADKKLYYELTKIYGESLENLLGELISVIDDESKQAIDEVKIKNVDAGLRNQFIPYAVRENVALSSTGGLIVGRVEDNKEYILKYYGDQSLEFIDRFNGNYDQDNTFILSIDAMKMLPFYTDVLSTDTSKIIEYLNLEMAYRGFVYDVYTRLPERAAKETVQRFQMYSNAKESKYCEKINFGIDVSMEHRLQELYERITLAKNFLFQETQYSLQPGATPKGKDAIDYFVNESKRGYCGYYASAGVILLRSMGIPARYIEGYVVTDLDYVLSSIVEGKRILDIQDMNAHAWVEVYLDYVGWVPIEMTEGYSYDESSIELPLELQNLTKKENTGPVPTPIPVSTPLATLNPSIEPNEKQDSKDLIKKEYSFLISEKMRRVFNILGITTILFFMMILVLYVRFRVMVKKKTKAFTSKNSNKRVTAIYKEIEKMAFYKCHMPRTNKLEENIEQVREGLFYVELEKWNRLILIGGKAVFSQSIVNQKELAFVEELHRYIQNKFYYRSHYFQRLYYKYIKIF